MHMLSLDTMTSKVYLRCPYIDMLSLDTMTSTVYLVDLQNIATEQAGSYVQVHAVLCTLRPDLTAFEIIRSLSDTTLSALFTSILRK